MTLARNTLVTLRVVQGLVLAGVAAYAAQATVAICGSAADAFFETYVYAALILAAGALCIGRAVIVPQERAAWMVLGAGLLAWGAGEVYYSVALDGLTEPPLPSVADVLWLAFYPCCYTGIVLLLRERVREFRRSLWLDGVLGALAVAAVATALVFDAIAGGGAGGGAVRMDLVYLLGDVLLIGFVVAVFAVTGWRPGHAWTLLGAGLALGAAVDAFFLYQAAVGLDVQSTLPAALWPASALIIGCAAWQRPARQVVRIDGWRVLALPAVFATVALGLLAWHTVHPLNAVALVLALATLAAVIVRTAMTLSENVRLLDGLRSEALTDALTGLGNRRRLMNDLEVAVEGATPQRPCALIMFDLDGFKQYNDRFGHPLGDALLARLGRGLALAVDGDGDAYRLGGDEFCVVYTGPPAGIGAVVARASEALSEEGQGFDVTSSYGTVIVPEEATDVSHALHVADERLYQQKGEARRATVTRQTSEALMQVLRETQPTLNGHLSDVAWLARSVGQRFGLGMEELEDLTRAAQLHDIGKVAVPSEILGKPGPLSDSEWDFVRQHTLVGDRILSAAPSLTAIARLVRSSHEKFDGTGYPDGLGGPEIPLAARIVAVCDAYHAMTTERPYRRSVDRDQALEELRRCAGGQFDPQVVAAFCDVVASRMDRAA
jgi:two-component system cell cycle response regulator